MADAALLVSHEALARALVRPATEAARLQLRLRREGVATEHKADNSVVTQADRESEAILLAALSSVAPGVPVVAEEEVAAGRVPSIGSSFFLVDPLDGTREYVAGGDDFTVNVAFVTATVPRFGLVLQPVTGDLYLTLGDDRAVHAVLPTTDTDVDFDAIAFETIRTRAPVAGQLVGVMSRTHRSAEDDVFAARHGVTERRSVGSSLKFCLVAKGEADVYPRFGSISEWDTAAGHAIVRAAGGAVLTATGEPLRYGKAEHGFINPPFVAWGRQPATVRDGR